MLRQKKKKNSTKNHQINQVTTLIGTDEKVKRTKRYKYIRRVICFVSGEGQKCLIGTYLFWGLLIGPLYKTPEVVQKEGVSFRSTTSKGRVRHESVPLLFRYQRRSCSVVKTRGFPSRHNLGSLKVLTILFTIEKPVGTSLNTLLEYLDEK